MSENMKWVQVNVRLYRKEKPKSEYLGLTSESYNFCKDKPQSLSKLLHNISLTIADFASQVLELTNDELQEQLDLFKEDVKNWEVRNK